jgi:hypothetical protein
MHNPRIEPTRRLEEMALDLAVEDVEEEEMALGITNLLVWKIRIRVARLSSIAL